MFEESEWRDGEAAPPAAPRRPAPQAPRSPRRLLAVLHRLQGLACRPGATVAGGGGGSESEAEAEARPGRKRLRRGPDPGPAGRRRPRGEGGGSDGASPGAAAAAGRRAPLGAAGEKQKRVPGGAPEEDSRQALTRRQWRNRQKNKRRQKNKFKAGVGTGEPPSCQLSPKEPPGDPDSPALLASPAEKPSGTRAASLRLRVEERLDAARFRYLNQLLYTRPSQEAARLFQEDPESFAVYHRGFARQVARWPESPVQRLARYLRHRPASLVVADFGCGDCTLAHSVRNKVHCFDLVALDPRVTVCDMAQVPLEAESVDVVVFCLALMGTNLHEILQEASRVLRLGGTLLVAEVASRFADVRAFVGALAQLGFRLQAKDVSGSHFYIFELRKTAAALPRKTLPGLALRPCLYKRR
ncbi:ribosomal RNA-processing protein 8 [Tiliqua scincoides]|uniref:ribosomal RNA-processing protein 8 n=1 Tax=Tiliqua scincoides TaxID=71010 RepID=UPI003462314B